MNRGLTALFLFFLVAVSGFLFVFLTPKKESPPKLFQNRPLIARHPTCPIEIVEVKNLNTQQKFFWHNIELVVKNRTPNRIKNISASLTYIPSGGIGTRIPYRLNAYRSPMLPSENVCVPPLPPELWRSVGPNETVSVYCSASQNHNNRIQQAMDHSRKFFFEVITVEFDGIQWNNGKFLTVLDGNPELRVNEEFTQQMYFVLGVPKDWEKSQQYLQDYVFVVQ